MERKEEITAIIMVAVMVWSLVFYAASAPIVFAWGAAFGIALSGIAVLGGARP